MNHRIIFYLVGLAFFIACSSEGKRQKADGFEYQIVRKGTNETIPVENYVFFNMDLYYKDSLIQSSAESPQKPVLKITAEKKDYGYFTSLIALLGKMHVGDSFHFFFPVDSFRQIPPGFEGFTEPVVYRVGVVDVMDETQFKAFQDSINMEVEKARQIIRDRLPEIEGMVKSNLEAFKKGELDSKIKTTSSGLKYIVHEEGDGGMIAPGQNVSVHYYGVLTSSGEMFDNSFTRGQPYTFPLGRSQVIQGWDEGIALMTKGTKATLFVPAAMAYGAAGNPPKIGPDQDLMFYIEIQK